MMKMKRFKVVLPKGRPLVVYADYYKVEAGVAVFRISLPNSYPQLVLSIAAGCWTRIWCLDG